MFIIVDHQKVLTTSRTELFSVSSPILLKLRYAYRRNRQIMFYRLVYFKIKLERAVKSYKQYFFVQSPKQPFSVSLTMF